MSEVLHTTTDAADALVPTAPIPGRLSAALLIAAMSLVVNHVFPHWKETNACSRLYLTLAVVEDGTLAIDGPLARYGDTQDKAFHADRHFTDKAPGYSLALVPLAWLLRATFVSPDDYNQIAWWLRALGLSFPAAWFWWWAIPKFLRITRDSTMAVSLALAGALATPWAIYSSQLFAHVPAGMLLFISWSLVVSWDDGPRRVTSLHALLAGLLSSLAFTCDYIVVLAVAIVWLTTWFTDSQPRWKPPLLFLLGSLPPLLAWAAYNQACFDHPLRVGFQLHADAQYGAAYRSGLWGMQIPELQSLLGLLWSPARGLFFFAPVLLLSFAGWWQLAAQRPKRVLACSSIAICLAIYAFALTTVDWRGGWSYGPRYLVPLIPFALMGVAGNLADGSARRGTTVLFAALTLVGLVWATLASATFPLFPSEFANPCRSLLLPLARAGLTAETLFTPLLGAAGAWPIYLGGLLAAGLVLHAAYRVCPEPAAPLALTASLAAIVLAWQISLPDRAVDARDQTALRAQLMTRLGHFEAASQTLLSITTSREAAP